MYNCTKLVFIVAAALLSGCATQLPLAPVSPKNPISKIESNVLLVNSNLEGIENYKSSQVLRVWEYPLSKVLPLSIESSLRNIYESVNVSNMYEGDTTSYDLIVTPKLDAFKARVPAFIFMPTKTNIAITYLVSDLNKGTKKEVSCSADQNKIEKFYDLYSGIDETIKKTYVAVGLAPVPIDNYDYLAARDAHIAIVNCLFQIEADLISLK